MNTTTATRPAIGTCLWASHTIRAEAKPAAQFTVCPHCEPVGASRSHVKWTTIRAKVTATECDGACQAAKGSRCDCNCGGRNHGTAHEVR